MEIVEGKVSNYKGHGDIFRNYGKINGEIKYYFLDYSPFSNGNMIATTDLVEAIDSEVSASHIGLIDKDGQVVIPLENKTVKPLTDNIILVEKTTPTSQNVLDSIELSKNNNGAASLVALTNACKNKVMAKIGNSSELAFHNQLSEASIFDIDGKNLVNDEYYSYIGVDDNTIYLGKNVEDAPIYEFPIHEEKSSMPVSPEGDKSEESIDVKETSENNSEEIKETVDNEMKSVEKSEDVSLPEVANDAPVEEKTEETPVDDSNVQTENVQLPDMEEKLENVLPVGAEDVAEVVGTEETQVVDASDVAETVGASQEAVTPSDSGLDDIFVEGEVPVSDKPVEEVQTENVEQVIPEVVTDAPVEEIAPETPVDVTHDSIVSSDVTTDTTDDLLAEPSFSDLNVDTIDAESYNFDESKYEYEPVSGSYNDDVLSSASKVMESLINQNRRQRSELNKLNLDLDKANNNIRIKQEQFETVQNRLEIATNKLRNQDVILGRLENNNSLLKSKLAEQKRLLDSQARDLANKDNEIERLKREVQGKEDLARYVQDARSLLGESSY